MIVPDFPEGFLFLQNAGLEVELEQEPRQPGGDLVLEEAVGHDPAGVLPVMQEGLNGEGLGPVLATKYGEPLKYVVHIRYVVHLNM